MNLKKRSILDTATRLFSQHGYHSVGVDKIVEQSNVAKMTFYKHFPSKEFLIESVLIKRDQDLRESILGDMAKRRTPKTKIKSIFEWYEAWFLTADFHGCMFIKAIEEFPELDTKIRKASQDHKIWVEELLTGLLKECGVKSSRDVAVQILIILDGLTVRINMFKSEAKELVATAWRQVDAMIKAES